MQPIQKQLEMQVTKSNFDVSKVMGQLSEAAPASLFFVMLLCFGYMGLLQYEYYTHIYSTTLPDKSTFFGIASPLILQLLRIASGLTSANFFKHGRFFPALLVFAFSVYLSYWEHLEADHLYQYFSKVDGNDGAILDFMRLAIWSALVLEFFLAVGLSYRDMSEDVGANVDVDMQNDVSFSQNGTTKKRTYKRSKS